MTSTPVLTTIIGCGNTISFIALALNLIQSPYYCVSWVWLWNIGYFLSIVALITKPVVVSQFRLDKRITKHVHRLLRKENRKERDKKAAIVATAGSRTDPSSPTTAPLPKFSIETQPPLSPSGIAPPQNYPHSPHPASPNGSSISNEPKPLIVSASKQLPSMIALFVALFAGLIAWTVISPPTYVEMVSGECVVTNACTSSTSPIFETVNHILRLLAIGGAVLTVISLRNTKGIRTELKSISFVVYNWTVFEILQVAVSSILANSPASQFIVTGITVLIPNLICIGMIVIRPVIICSSTPVQELSERVQIQNSVYNSVTSSMRESSMGVSMAMSRTWIICLHKSWINVVMLVGDDLQEVRKRSIFERWGRRLIPVLHLSDESRFKTAGLSLIDLYIKEEKG